METNEIINQILSLPEESLGEIFEFYLGKEETIIISRLLALRKVPEIYLNKGFNKFFFKGNKNHLDYSKLSLILPQVRAKEIKAPYWNKFINEMYQYYLCVFSIDDKLSFYGERNFLDIISFLNFLKDYDSVKIRYLSEILIESFAKSGKLNYQKVKDNVFKILKFSKQY